MITETLYISPDALERRTGWSLKPQGLCKDDRCVPLPGHDGGDLDLRLLSERLGMPLVEEPARSVWCLGPESGGKALTSARAPDVELPDPDGRPFALRSLRGQKVFLLAWASW